MEIAEPLEIVIVVPLETEAPQEVPVAPAEVPTGVPAGAPEWAEDDAMSAAQLRACWLGSRPW